MNIKWSDNLNSGFPLIDSQHREIFEQAEKFLRLGRSGHSKENLGELLAFFESYINRHLALEEELQRQYDYPDLKSHKQLHNNFREKYRILRSQFETGGAQYQLAVKAIVFTLDWLTDHIERVDKSMAGYIRSKELCQSQPEKKAT